MFSCPLQLLQAAGSRLDSPWSLYSFHQGIQQSGSLYSNTLHNTVFCIMNCSILQRLDFIIFTTIFTTIHKNHRNNLLDYTENTNTIHRTVLICFMSYCSTCHYRVSTRVAAVYSIATYPIIHHALAATYLQNLPQKHPDSKEAHA